ncbi:MAG: hypothetical protein ABIP89_20890, partial [Polyangiaceae bacterium]
PFGGTGAPTFTPPPGSFAPGPQASQHPAAYQQYQPPSPYGSPPYGAPPPTYGGGYQPPIRAKSGGGALVWIIVITLLLVGTGVGIAVLLQLRSSKTSSSAVTPSEPFTPFTSEPVTTPTADNTADTPTADPTKPRIATKPTTTPTTPIGTSKPFPSSSSANPVVTPPITGIGSNLPKTGTCKASLTLTLFNPSTRTCSFNTTANQTPGTLTFPCSGGGAATGTFGKQTFRGSISNGSFTLTNTDPFTFSGCNVESSQTIFGSITSGSGSYTYSERETGGTCSGVSTCRASARVTSSTPVAAGGNAGF